MTLGIQVDGNNSQRSIVITEISPELEYYIVPDVSVAFVTYTTLTFTGTPFAVDAYNGMVVLVLTGAHQGRCYTIQDTTTSTIVLYEDATGSITTSTYIAVIHTAATMYAYCNTNGYDCLAISCETISGIDGSDEAPQSLATHITYRLGTGVFKQGVTFNNCEIWNADPRIRAWKFGQAKHLVFHWNKIGQQTAVYLIETVEHISGGIHLYQNIDYFNEESGYDDIECRGYLKGYPLNINSTYQWNATFTLTFIEAWML